MSLDRTCESMIKARAEQHNASKSPKAGQLRIDDYFPLFHFSLQRGENHEKRKSFLWDRFLYFFTLPKIKRNEVSSLDDETVLDRKEEIPAWETQKLWENGPFFSDAGTLTFAKKRETL